MVAALRRSYRFQCLQSRKRSARRVLPCLLLALTAFSMTAATSRAQTVLTGIDVSNWQRQIDWLTASASGHAFVYAKATESTSFSDVTFPLNRSGATIASMRFGAYHFARPAGSSDAAAVASAIEQADRFLAFAQPKRGELLPALDLEVTGRRPVKRLNIWVGAWLAEVNATLGVKPIVYVSPEFWKTALGDSPVPATSGHPLWIAHWTKAALPILPGANWGGMGWSFWQWTSCQRVPGIGGCVDGDRFNGPSLTNIAIPSYPSGKPVPTASPSIVGSARSGKLLAATSGEWRGGKPASFTYQWQRCSSAAVQCAAIIGADKPGYTPSKADVGKTLTVKVAASTPGGSGTALSLPTLPVLSAGPAPGTAPKPVTIPSIVGTAQLGETLSALTGAWKGAPSSFALQWRRCGQAERVCTDIAGALSSKYTLVPGDIGATVTVVVTALGAGGAASATSEPSAIITAAPIPAPSIATAIAASGQAGAVTSQGAVAIASWQPGTLPNGAIVRLSDTSSRLSVPGTAVILGIGATAPLPWPIDVEYALPPIDAVPGILPGKGVWQPLGELSSAMLPFEQQAGAYRDDGGSLHVLTRSPGRIALFAAGRWGDPRFTIASRANLGFVSEPTLSIVDSIALVYGRFTLDRQAHIYASVATDNGSRVMLTQQGSRIGTWLQGKPAKTLQALQLQPGALPLRLRFPARLLRGHARLTLRILAVDPYGRRATLAATIPAPR